MNDFFVQQTDLKVSQAHFEYIDKSGSECLSWEGPPSISHIRVKQTHVLGLLLDLNVSKATGSDLIPALFLKRCALSLVKPLTHLFPSFVDTGIFPSQWKIADVVALHKKGSKSDVTNYRPISLLPIISKMMESVVSKYLSAHLAPMLNPRQFGFRSGHTSLDLLLNMTQRWIDAVASGKEVRAAALDISKAFDKVWHAGLLLKLEKQFGVCGGLLRWFRSYLSGRTQHVVVNSARSASKPILAGVPQGSVLGPLLFLVFINDLFGVVTNELDVFADDSSLWAIVESPALRAEVANSLNTDLAAIEEWAHKWLVVYNQTKTEVVLFSTKRDVSAFHSNGLHRDGFFEPGPVPCPHPPLTFFGTQLPERPQVKIVGLVLTHNLTWGAHVESVYRKANRSLALLRRARPVLNDKGLATIYKSFIRSQLEYCCPLWLGAPKTSLARLDRIQVRAVSPRSQRRHSAPVSGAPAGCGGCLCHAAASRQACPVPAPLPHSCPNPC